jgi:hypothetical protein
MRSSNGPLESPASAAITSTRIRVGKYCSMKSAGDASNIVRASWRTSETSLARDVYGAPSSLSSIGAPPAPTWS